MRVEIKIIHTLNTHKPMHKSLPLIAAFLLMSAPFVSAQSDTEQPQVQQRMVFEGDTVTSDTLKPVGVHPWKKVAPVTPEEAFWTLYIQGGLNVFDGDFTSEKDHAVQAPTLGIGAAYYFNNTWSIGAEYLWRRYGVKGKGTENTAPVMLKGMAHQADAYITFDIFNAWRPQNKFKLFALHLIAGGGAGWFKTSLYYPNEWHKEPDGVTVTFPQYFNYHTAQQKYESDSKYTWRSLFLGGASFEFNVNRSLALGVRGVYTYYIKDDIDGRIRGNNNDGVFDVTVLLRYKIDAVNKSHVANFRSEKALASIVMETNPNATDGGSNTAAAAPAGKDTVYIIERDTIVAVRGARDIKPEPTYDQKIFYVYFDPNEYTLYDQALKTIQQVADRMQSDDDLYIEITGYCDNTGADEYNKTLGMNRAKSVAEEFIMEHGIDSARIKKVGRGIIRGRRSTAAYSPNRRVVIRIMSKDEFEQNYGEKSADNQMLPAPKSIVVEGGETLSSIARKYYGNTHCWIYIFEANLDKLATPSSLKQGMELSMPQLTEGQRTISKVEAAKRYEKHRL